MNTTITRLNYPSRYWQHLTRLWGRNNNFGKAAICIYAYFTFVLVLAYSLFAWTIVLLIIVIGWLLRYLFFFIRI